MIRAMFTLLLTITVGTVMATELGFNPTPIEMQRMPAYCKAKFTAPQGSPGWQIWRDRLGENFIDIHHYCSGLNWVNRYWSTTNVTDRKFYLERALDEITYMVKAQKPGFPLRANVLSSRGDVFKLAAKPGEAIKDFSEAVAINPKMVKPYLQLAKLYVDSKNQRQALEAISEGLRYTPDSTALQSRYLELGGKKPFPEPVAQQASETGAAETESAPADTASSEPSDQVTPATPAEEPRIGTPTNPYCRFCPPE